MTSIGKEAVGEEGKEESDSERSERVIPGHIIGCKL